jgi:hypothetical protein
MLRNQASSPPLLFLHAPLPSESAVLAFGHPKLPATVLKVDNGGDLNL